MTEETLVDTLLAHSRHTPQAPALLAPGRLPLHYAGLWQQVSGLAANLAEAGVGPGDRVALVLPGGPELAVACLGTAMAAACAPLNPAYREREFAFYLDDLRARALVVAAGSDSPAVAVARARGMTVLELVPDLAAPAGTCRLVSAVAPTPAAARLVPFIPPAAQRDRPSLLLHTSGTTARPKLVALTQRQLLLSAANVGRSLTLTAVDRCLNVMPLFHIHGLVAGLLASLAAGGSVAVTPGFSAPLFFDWLDELTPTWYTAVPSLHQAVLARAVEQPARAAGRLRLVRSSSAALPPQISAALEQAFGAPVIEAYGMTEAAHQVASHPLPPRPRKARSVGLAAGPEVAIMAPEGGTLLPPGSLGEVVIRGPSVMTGYEANPDANRAAFAHGWFRTGDQGYLDEDGYLFLTGRLKELINHGGEKVAPGEVEEALLDHPAVAQAAAFALPDARLGEVVAAAVVLRPGVTLDEHALRRFVATRLAHFKVPARLISLAALPTAATGKVQRLGLAERLGLTGQAPAAAPTPYVPPASDSERRLAALWQAVLKCAPVGRHDRFLDLGGDSLLAGQLVGRVAEALGLQLTLLDFFDAPTIAEQAALLEALTPSRGPLANAEAAALTWGSL